MCVRACVRRPVEPRSKTKSMMAAKSFSAIRDADEVERWMATLSHEIAVRVRDEYDANGRWPRTMQVHFLVPGSDARSKSGPFPSCLNQEPPELATAILRTAKKLLGVAGIPVPCVRVAVRVRVWVRRVRARAVSCVADAWPAAVWAVELRG